MSDSCSRAVIYSTIDILGVLVDCVDFTDMLDIIERWIAEARAGRSPTRQIWTRQLCTVNPEFIMEARRDADFAAVLRRADLRVPDGVGVLWAAKLVGVHLRERVTGSDGIYRICERAAQCGWRVYFLGAAEGVAERAAQTLTRLYPDLQCAGAYAGSPSESEWPAIHARLSAAQPDILFVAYGHPKQDKWIDRHRRELPATLAMGVGGAFDFVTGTARRAPRWAQRLGIEWLHRLVRQPWRWRRMARLPLFALLVLVARIRRSSTVKKR